MHEIIARSIFIIPVIVSMVFGFKPEAKVEAQPEATPTAEVAEPPSTPVQEVKQEAKIETKEQIENYIREKFGASADTMLAIAKCESGLNPSAKNSHSSASGVFQVIKGTWEGNTDASWEMRFDAKTNIDTAYTLWSRRGIQPWECKKLI